MTEHLPSTEYLRALVNAAPPEAMVMAPRKWLVDLLDRIASPPPPEPAEDTILTVAEVSERLVVTKDWLYRHWQEIPGAHKLGQKQLRFTSAGLARYIAGERMPKERNRPKAA
jgi:hypothetical protein